MRRALALLAGGAALGAGLARALRAPAQAPRRSLRRRPIRVPRSCATSSPRRARWWPSARRPRRPRRRWTRPRRPARTSPSGAARCTRTGHAVAGEMRAAVEPEAALSPRRSERAPPRLRARARRGPGSAALRSSRRSAGFVMKPVSTSTTGTSAQLKPGQVGAAREPEVAGAGRGDERALHRARRAQARAVDVARPAAPQRGVERGDAAAATSRCEPSAWIRSISAAPCRLQKRARSTLPPRKSPPSRVITTR